MSREGLQIGGPPTSVLLVGGGAIENSWDPVRQALLKFFRDLPNGEENSAFATVVYELRHLALATNAGILVTGVRDWWAVRGKLSSALEEYDALKAEIATRLSGAGVTGEIRPRSFLGNALKPVLAASGEYIVVTTNWDTTLTSVFPSDRVFHIHGDIDDPDSLYLPMEQAWEPYRRYSKSYRSQPRHYGRLTHGNWLVSRTRTLFVTGLSLSPLDAELNTLVRSMAYPKGIDTVVVIDPSPESVMRKLEFHARGKITKRVMVRPDCVASTEWATHLASAQTKS
jgi:hypothetical protein